MVVGVNCTWKGRGAGRCLCQLWVEETGCLEQGIIGINGRWRSRWHQLQALAGCAEQGVIGINCRVGGDVEQGGVSVSSPPDADDTLQHTPLLQVCSTYSADTLSHLTKPSYTRTC